MDTSVLRHQTNRPAHGFDHGITPVSGSAMMAAVTFSQRSWLFMGWLSDAEGFPE
jgi:hypothetical protein